MLRSGRRDAVADCAASRQAEAPHRPRGHKRRGRWPLAQVTADHTRDTSAHNTGGRSSCSEHSLHFCLTFLKTTREHFYFTYSPLYDPAVFKEMFTSLMRSFYIPNGWWSWSLTELATLTKMTMVASLQRPCGAGRSIVRLFSFWVYSNKIHNELGFKFL